MMMMMNWSLSLLDYFPPKLYILTFKGSMWKKLVCHLGVKTNYLPILFIYWVCGRKSHTKYHHCAVQRKDCMHWTYNLLHRKLVLRFPFSRWRLDSFLLRCSFSCLPQGGRGRLSWLNFISILDSLFLRSSRGQHQGLMYLVLDRFSSTSQLGVLWLMKEVQLHGQFWKDKGV